MSKAIKAKIGFATLGIPVAVAITTEAALHGARAGNDYASPDAGPQHVEVNYSKLPGRTASKSSVWAEFFVDRKVGGALGFDNASDAVMAFYQVNEDAYQETDSDTELVAFLVRSSDRRFHVTTAAVVPATFHLRAAMRLPKYWRTQEVIHTHPPRHYSQEGFSVEDRDSVIAGLPGYFVRTPLGDVRYLDKQLAWKTRNPCGARGKSLCPGGQSCLARHRDKT